MPSAPTRILTKAASILGMMFLASCATASTSARSSVQRDVVYTPAGWPEALKADIHFPAHPPSQSPAHSLAPAVLLIHGGGWAPPDRRSQMNSIAERLAARGYLVMNATYRFSPKHLHPAPVEDLRQALVWLRQNAQELNIDSQRVAAFGYSAGGHLAALLGALDAPPEQRVSVVVGGGTPTELAKWADGKLVVQYLGGRPGDVPQQYAAASPIRHITAQHPPTFLYHGSFDWVVPLDHATDYKAALDQQGIPNELYVMRGLGHVAAFFLDGEAVDRAVQFMDRHLARN